MTKTTLIIVALMLTIIALPNAMALDPTINLCEKTPDEGDSWGVCDPLDISKAQGTFTYNTVGSALIFTAHATGLSEVDSTSYSLIYYKDSDPNHKNASTFPSTVLATATSLNGEVTFSGTYTIGNIPASDDVNPRGKIWIIPSLDITTDSKPSWSRISEYLFESDMYNMTERPSPEFSVIDRMGGITYTKLLGTVRRTMDKDYLRIGDTGKSINITLTGNNISDSDVPAWGAIETLPTAVVITLMTSNASIEENKIVTMGGNELKYKITVSSGAISGTYSISGTFIDAYKQTGVITPNVMSIRILPVCNGTHNGDPVCYYDTNGISGIQRSEIIDAVRAYFEGPLTLGNVLKVVRAYLGL